MAELPKHKPGTYLAKAADWSITKTQSGLPQVSVLFRYQEDASSPRELIWWGSFKETVVERTIETLVALGLKGPLEGLAEGLPGGALSTEKLMEIVVEHRQDNSGNVRAGISWVNDPQRKRNLGTPMSKAEAAQALKGWNGLLAMKRGDAAPQSQAFTDQDIPF